MYVIFSAASLKNKMLWRGSEWKWRRLGRRLGKRSLCFGFLRILVRHQLKISPDKNRIRGAPKKISARFEKAVSLKTVRWRMIKTGRIFLSTLWRCVLNKHASGSLVDPLVGMADLKEKHRTPSTPNYFQWWSLALMRCIVLPLIELLYRRETFELFVAQRPNWDHIEGAHSRRLLSILAPIPSKVLLIWKRSGCYAYLSWTGSMQAWRAEWKGAQR